MNIYHHPQENHHPECWQAVFSREELKEKGYPSEKYWRPVINFFSKDVCFITDKEDAAVGLSVKHGVTIEEGSE